MKNKNHGCWWSTAFQINNFMARKLQFATKLGAIVYLVRFYLIQTAEIPNCRVLIAATIRCSLVTNPSITLGFFQRR